ncbi:hypothetical protein CDAR_505041 [Caerostris darwini]|uniref:Uncharacterized protein n=1 Tax=Caerostris darwini TaxID=1538125 RepID=A0AAV4MEZ0_9ARAC|nr:hypothetical protein CDAR_505041 [Caerostris darwini]
MQSPEKDKFSNILNVFDYTTAKEESEMFISGQSLFLFVLAACIYAISSELYPLRGPFQKSRIRNYVRNHPYLPPGETGKNVDKFINRNFPHFPALVLNY